MIRTVSTIYSTEDGRTLIRIDGESATVIPHSCSADELDELSRACIAAADELRAAKEVEATT